MVASKDRALNLEKVFWVTEVVQQLVRNITLRGDSSREYLGPHLEQRVVFIPLVESDCAVVGINSGLD